MNCSKRIIFLVTAIMMLLCISGCDSGVPEEYLVDSSNVKLPEQINQGYYMLKDISAMKYHTADQSVDKALYFKQVADTEFRITDDEFSFGSNTIKSPYYREIKFNGIIRVFMGKEDIYRAIDPSEAGSVDADESGREVTRCFVITKSDGTDTNYRLYMMDDELWVAHFYWDGDTLECEDIFVLTYDKIKNKFDNLNN